MRSIEGVRRVLVLGLALLVAGGISATAGAALPKLHVVIKGQSHHPVVGKTWSYSVTVTNAAGKPVACTIHLQMLLSGGGVVGEVGRHAVKNGVWKETIVAHGPDAFPPAAVGEPLVLQATVTAKGYAPAKAGWSIAVVKKK
ncbi:MAG TPA: hypothetical protein VMT74_01515 [Gaiellaceae bacterium]|nr:hypothetical protein [Gaiellaceae bacterium]